MQGYLNAICSALLEQTAKQAASPKDQAFEHLHSILAVTLLEKVVHHGAELALI